MTFAKPKVISFNTPRQAPKGDKPIGELRRRLAALERRAVAFGETAERHGPRWTFDIESIDDALPEGALTETGLHEVVSAAHRDGAAAAGFALALMARRTDTRPLLWCEQGFAAQEFGALYGPGLKMLGLCPENLILIRTRTDQNVLWALEEGLKSGALGAVVGEVREASFTATRRLTLASQTHRVPSLLVRAGGGLMASAAATRWRVTSLPSAAGPFDDKAPGAPRWYLELLRCRGGRPHSWTVDWQHETGSFNLAAPLADRPHEAGGEAILRAAR